VRVEVPLELVLNAVHLLEGHGWEQHDQNESRHGEHGSEELHLVDILG